MRPVDLNKLQALVQPVVDGQGYELVDLEWKLEAGRWVLRVYIDRAEGAPARGPAVPGRDASSIDRAEGAPARGPAVPGRDASSIDRAEGAPARGPAVPGRDASSIDRADLPGQPTRVSLDDCANVSHELSAVLDVKDVLPSAYTLEVSSPGLNRPLKRAADFRRFVGQKAKIRTRHGHPADGEATRRNFAGKLLAVEPGPPEMVRIDVGDRTYDVPVDDVEKANLIYEFDGQSRG